MKEFPTLQTDRLILRAFSLDDAADVQHFACDRDIAAATTSIPHPYEDGMAEKWIGTHREDFESGKGITSAIESREDTTLIEAIELRINQQHSRAEMGYWIGKPYGNHGYCTEAAKVVIRYGFEALGLNRIQARHFTHTASGHVLTKCGMTREGCMRQHVLKWGKFVDVEMYSILKKEYM